jgi:hypothetical protein
MTGVSKLLCTAQLIIFINEITLQLESSSHRTGSTSYTPALPKKPAIGAHVSNLNGRGPQCSSTTASLILFTVTGFHFHRLDV